MDISQLPIGGCSGYGVVQIMADYQSFLETNLKQEIFLPREDWLNCLQLDAEYGMVEKHENSTVEDESTRGH